MTEKNTLSISQQEFAQRRKTFLSQMKPNSIALLAAAPEVLRNGFDNLYPYRQNSDFYYLTGFCEPEAVAILIPGRKEGEFILFNREKNPDKEKWTGYYAGLQGAMEQYAADQAFVIDELHDIIIELFLGKQTVYYHTARDSTMDELVMDTTHELQRKVRAGMGAPTEFINLETILHDMRLLKSENEIALMRKACDISTKAHLRAMQYAHAGVAEYELQAEVEHEFKSNGMTGPAYTSIVAGGGRACILHYIENNQIIRDGELVLIDAGGESQGYSADLTRTFPVNGKFTTEQKAVYEAVLTAQLAVIAAIKPGLRYDQFQQLAQMEITKGLLKLGLLQGNLDTLIAEKAYNAFYYHNIGHWLGLDTHDAGDYKNADGQWRPLQAGMVLTVEPGIYIAGNNPNVDRKWWNIGVRIEDNVLVTEKGSDVLSKHLSKTVADIETLMAKKA